jgi:SEC-C motif
VIRRNDPCPCGSGLKFKKCCLLKPPGPGRHTTGPIRFEPGTYGSSGAFVPSLACVRDTTEGTKYLFVLANPAAVFGAEQYALARAKSDFSEACRIDDATTSIEAMGRQLAGLGYVVVENFKVIPEDA